MSNQQRLHHRSVPLQVLHLSMPRTGSLSMKAAYEKLGLPTYHGFDFSEHTDHQIPWKKAVDAKFKGKGSIFSRDDFDSFLGDYAVLSDFPVIGFWDDLVRLYPEAKVVLVERDLDKWTESFINNVVAANFTLLAYILWGLVEPLIPIKTATLMWDFEQAYFRCHDRASFAANARATYKRHYASVRDAVPAENLLTYRLGSGWQPLCEFLGLEIPDEPFPRLNESKEFIIWMRKMQQQKLLEGLALLRKYVLPVTIILAALWWYPRNWRVSN